MFKSINVLIALSVATFLCSGVAQAQFSRSFRNNSAPSFQYVNGTKDLKLNVGVNEEKDITLVATDSDGDALSFAIYNMNHPNFTIREKNILHLAPKLGDEGVYDLEVRVSDGFGRQDTMHVFVTVTHGVNHVPVIDGSIAPITLESFQVKNVTINASDADRDALTYTLTSNRDASHFKMNGNVLHLAPTKVDIGNHALVVSVSDGQPNSAPVVTTINLTVTAIPNRPPVLTFNERDLDKQMRVGEEQYLRFSATDPDGDLLTYTLTSPVSFNSTSFKILEGNILHLLPVAGDEVNHDGNYELIVQVSDGQLITKQSIMLKVRPVLNNPPVLNFIGQSGLVMQADDAAKTVQFQATDADKDPLTYSMTTNLTNAHFSLTPNGVLTLAPKDGDEGTYNLDITVSDHKENGKDTKRFTVTILRAANRAPVVTTVIPDQTMTFAETKSIDLSQYINDPDRDIVIYSIFSSQAVTGMIEFENPSTLIFHGVRTSSYTITIKANDGRTGHEISQSFQLTINPIVPKAAEITTPANTVNINPLQQIEFNWTAKAGVGALKYSLELSTTKIDTNVNTAPSAGSTDVPVGTTSLKVSIPESFINQPKLFVTLWTLVGTNRWLSNQVEYNLIVNQNTGLEVPVFDKGDGVYQTPIQLNITTPVAGARILYTLNGQEPVLGAANTMTYAGPITIRASSVVKARIVTIQGLSAVVAKAYLINVDSHDLGIASLVTLASDRANITFYDPTDRFSSSHFTSTGTLSVQQNQKDQQQKVRSYEADLNAQGQIFIGNTLARPRSIILSNVKNDTNLIATALLQRLAEVKGIAYSDVRPVVAFVNGQNEGIHVMQEVLDASKADLVHVTETALDQTKPANVAYTDMVNFFKTKDMSLPINYDEAKTRINIDQFIAKTLIDIYTANTSFATKNVWLTCPNNQCAWIMSNNENGAIFTEPVNHDTLNYVIERSEIFKKLLANDNFKRAFINQAADFLNGIAMSSAMEAMLKQIQNTVEIDSNNWSLATRSDWQANVEKVRSFINARADVMRTLIGSNSKLTIGSVLPQASAVIRVVNIAPDQGTVQINNLNVPDAQWQGVYFNGVRVTFKALPKSGYVFDSWKINGVYNLTNEIQEDPTAGMTVEVFFRPVSAQGNRAPKAVNDQTSILANSTTPVTIRIFDNDSDEDGDAITLKDVNKFSLKGTVTSVTGGVEYMPSSKFNDVYIDETATDTFTYTVKDKKGVVSNEATVTVTVKGVKNRAPVAKDDERTTTSDGQNITIDVLENDVDTADDTLSIVSFDATGIKGKVEKVSDKRLSYFLEHNFDDLYITDAPAVVSFKYVMKDSEGLTSTATVRILVAGKKVKNNDPKANDDSVTTKANQELDIKVLLNDTDIDADVLSITHLGNPNKGTTRSSVIWNGEVVYSPNGAFNDLLVGQTAEDTFTYSVKDGRGGISTATVRVTITGVKPVPVTVPIVNPVVVPPQVNHAPVAQNDEWIILADAQPVVLNFLLNDSDPDNGDFIYVSLLEPISKGKVEFHSPTGSFLKDGIIYDPRGSFNDVLAGSEKLVEFIYRVKDSKGEETTATVKITIKGVNPR